MAALSRGCKPRIGFALLADLMKLKTKLNCPKYSIQKDEFYNKVQFCVHNIKQLPPIEAIKEFMYSSNYFVNLQLMKFVLPYTDLRSKLLSI